MSTFTKLIPENIAPVGARRIGVYNAKGNRAGFINLGPLSLPTVSKMYSFGALSDVHVQYDTAQADFQAALSYLNNTEDVEFTCICGDLTVNGTDAELTTYKGYVDSYSSDTPVYAVFGNHDTYEGLYNNTEKYTKQPFNYTFTQGNDVFIMVGNISGYSGDVGTLFTEATLQWLYETLEANRNKRCFLFQHILSAKGSGDALGIYPYTKLSGNEAIVFESLISHYKNVVWFHGHSHFKFYLQEESDTANIDKYFGTWSVHIPSLSVPRDVSGNSYSTVYADSEGYVVDVYEDGIHLRGRDFVRETFIPVASYWLDTTLKTVEAGKYYDEVGVVGAVNPTELTYTRSDDATYYICTGVQEDFDSTTITIDGVINGLPVLSVGSGAFNGMSAVTKVIFKQTPESIAADAFTGCDAMATIVMPSAPNILDGSPWGSAYVRPRFEIGGVIYRRHSTLTTARYVIDGITSAFPGGKIEFVDYIGGDPVYEIDSSSFKNKTTITEVVIPASVKAIEASVFANCTGLTKVTFKGTPSSIPATAFDGCTNLLTINVPWAEDAKENAPWGATNATINYNYTGE